MFKQTKCDLSYDEAVVDYEAMRRVASYAFGQLRDQVAKNIHKTHELPFEKDAYSYYSNLKYAADHIAELAPKLATAAEVMLTLNEGLSRNNLIITNKPEVVEKRSL